MRYFLKIEIIQFHHSILLYKIKYLIDLLTETEMSGCKAIDTPMDPNTELMADAHELLNSSKYVHNVGKQAQLPCSLHV